MPDDANVLASQSASTATHTGVAFDEAFPTIASVHALLHSATYDDESALAKLGRIFLRVAYIGDIDLLGWMLRRRQSDQGSSASALLSKLDIRSLRDQADHGALGPVSLAASSGHVAAVEMLLNAGADIEETDAGES